MIGISALLKIGGALIVFFGLLFSVILHFQPLIAVLSFFRNTVVWIWSKLHPRPEKDSGSTSHVENVESVRHLESAGRDIVKVNKGQRIVNNYYPDGREQQSRSLRSDWTSDSAKSQSSPVDPQDSKSSDPISDQLPSSEDETGSERSSESRASTDSQTMAPGKHDETMHHESIEQSSAVTPDGTSTQTPIEGKVSEGGHKGAADDASFEEEEIPVQHLQLSERLTGTNDDEPPSTGSQMQLGALSEESNNAEVSDTAVSHAMHGDNALSAQPLRDAYTGAELTRVSPDIGRLGKELGTQIGQSALPDIFTVPEREEIPGDSVADILGILYDADDKPGKVPPMNNAAVFDEDSSVKSTQSFLPSVKQPPLSQGEGSPEDDNPWQGILDEFPLEMIGVVLQKQRVSVDIKQTDIDFDRGWVQALEDGMWRSPNYVSDLSLFHCLQRYLHVIGWSVEALNESLISHRRALAGEDMSAGRM